MIPAHYTLSIGAAATLLAGCSALPLGLSTGQDGTPPAIGAPSTIAQSRTIAPVANRSRSWMLAEAKSDDLLYAATGGNVYVLSYPRGKLVGSLNVAGNNLCSDKRGDVFIPSSSYQILEYAHAGTQPIQTLQGGDIPLTCAVDPSTGNLAVSQEGSGAGEVAIFPNAQEPATWYRDPDISTYGPCGYDDRGNLFVDGSGTANYLAELPKGSSAFTNYSLGNEFDVFGGVEWDGHHITLSNPSTGQIYRLRIGAVSFKIIGTTKIDGWQNNYSGHWPYIQTWIQGGTFIAQSSDLAEVGLWRYPSGGNARKVLGPFTSGSADIYGVTVSLAHRRNP